MTTKYTEEMEALAQKLGVEKLCALISIPPDKIKAALESGDEHLNSFPLAMWDKMTGALTEKGYPKYHYGIGDSDEPEVFKAVKGLSQSQRVCVLKHVATTYYLQPRPEPVPPAPYIPEPPIDYQAQAEAFLNKFGIKFRATLSDSKTAPWQPAGHHYRVTLNHTKPRYVSEGRPVNYGKRLVFDFWGSLHDAEKDIPVTACDVLACISGDAYGPDTFEDFCSEFGYEQDSIKALQIFKRAHAFSKRLKAFFTPEELEELSQIN